MTNVISPFPQGLMVCGDVWYRVSVSIGEYLVMNFGIRQDGMDLDIHHLVDLISALFSFFFPSLYLLFLCLPVSPSFCPSWSNAQCSLAKMLLAKWTPYFAITVSVCERMCGQVCVCARAGVCIVFLGQASAAILATGSEFVEFAFQ